MKKFLLFGLLLCSILVTFTSGYSNDDAWNDYKLAHGKNYTGFLGGGWRDQMRKQIFLAQHAKIKEHNSGKSPSYRRELNKFSDMLPSEWSRYLGLKASLAPTTRSNESTKVDLESLRQIPDILDYRYDRCMPEIKNQGRCGSCWAFAAIAPLEFAQCKKSSAPVVLSERQLVDCDRRNGGCNGGWYGDAWDYLKRVGGSAKQSLYSPYNARRNFCKFRTSMVGAQVSTYDYVAPNDAVVMQAALQKYGPLAVAFSVIDSFLSYASDVYDDPNCDNVELNHAVVIVGWGNLNGVDYWIARNSWGTSWGLSGYFLIKRGVNKCGIESNAAYVVPV